MREFEELVKAHYQTLYRFGMALSHNADVACDLVQETFSIWAAKGHQLIDRSKAKTWLFTTLYREFLQHQRRSSRFTPLEADVLESQDPMNVNIAEKRIDGNRILRLLGELPDVYKAPLTLFYLQQHSYKEIAEILEVPIGTIMSRLSRGKSMLKEKISKEPGMKPNLKETKQQERVTYDI